MKLSKQALDGRDAIVNAIDDLFDDEGREMAIFGPKGGNDPEVMEEFSIKLQKISRIKTEFESSRELKDSQLSFVQNMLDDAYPDHVGDSLVHAIGRIGDDDYEPTATLLLFDIAHAMWRSVEPKLLDEKTKRYVQPSSYP